MVATEGTLASNQLTQDHLAPSVKGLNRPMQPVAEKTLQLSPSKDSPPAADKDITNAPQQPMNPDMLATKDGHNAGSPNLQRPDTSLPRGDTAPSKTCQETTLVQDVEQPGAVNAVHLQVKFSRTY